MSLSKTKKPISIKEVGFSFKAILTLPLKNRRLKTGDR
jgi:hypothetical protein